MSVSSFLQKECHQIELHPNFTGQTAFLLYIKLTAAPQASCDSENSQKKA